MKKEILKKRLKESILALTELDVDNTETMDLVDKLGELSDRIDEMKATLKSLEKQYKEYSDILMPLFHEISETKDVAVRTEKYLISIKKKAYSYDRVAYQELYDTLYSKVNPAIRKIADELKKANTTLVNVAPKIGVQKIKNISEVNLMNTLKEKFISYINKLILKVDANTDDIQVAIDEFKLGLLNQK